MNNYFSKAIRNLQEQVFRSMEKEEYDGAKTADGYNLSCLLEVLGRAHKIAKDLTGDFTDED